MALKKITSRTIALLVAAALVLLVGIDTDNGGFQLAGALLLLVGLIGAVNEARNRGGPS